MKRAPSQPTQVNPEQAQAIQQAVFDVAETHLDERFFLIDVAFEKDMGYWYLRLYVDLKDGSISISECEAISRLLDPLLEALPVLSDVTYNLEVSSPGLFRPLKNAREYTFYKGEPVRVTGEPEIKNKKKAAKALLSDLPTLAEGILEDFNEAKQLVTLCDPDTRKRFEVVLREGQAVFLNPVIRFPEDEASAASATNDTL